MNNEKECIEVPLVPLLQSYSNPNMKCTLLSVVNLEDPISSKLLFLSHDIA